MKNKLPLSPSGGHAARLRRYAVLALCSALLTLAVASSFAQRRTAVRVPRGEAAEAPRREAVSPRAMAEERRREDAKARARGRAIAARLKAGQETITGPGGIATQQVGVPTEGAPGVTRTTDDIMVAQSNSPLSWRHDRVLPEREMPGRKYLPQDPNARLVARTPTSTARIAAVADTAAADAPQTVGTSFTGATLSDTGAFPPDSMGAVGPTQYFVFVNGRLRTFDKATGAADGVINADPDVFFAPVMTPVSGGSLNVNFTSDPMVRYDRLSGRWFVTIIDVPSVNDLGDTPNRYMIAVSDAASSNAITNATVWTFYFVQQDTVGLAGSNDEFLDYPSLGIDANALYMGGNMFSASAGNFAGTNAYVIRKSSLLSGGPVVTTAFRGLVVPPFSADGMLTPRGVDNYDPAATEGYFIGTSNLAFGRLIMRRVGTPAGTPTLSADILITVPATSFPVPVDHLGNANLADLDLDTFPDGDLDALDDRLYSAHIRGGRLWTAHNIAVTATGVASNTNTQRRNGVRWYELVVPPTTGTPTLNQSGTIFDPATNRATARQFWIPTVMVSGQGHAAFGYSTAGTAFRPDAATNGRLRGDTLGTAQAVNVYTASTGAYNPPSDPGPPRRWGDYSYTSLDPLDDMTMWTIQEFCDAPNSYGVRVAKLQAPPPASPNSASPNSIPAGQSSVSVVITGTSVSGSEFYDPGTNLAAPALPFNHISASVSGGVVVNNVTYNSPTQVTLDLNTTGASPGGKNVTITNPDGQSTTRNNVFFVGTAPTSPILITEFRFTGAAGGNDEFIEVYNNSNSPHTVADTAGGTGYAVVGTNTTGSFSTRCTVPNGTVIPARGHFLCTNSGASGYSLGGYAAGDTTYATGIVAGGGVAVFSTTVAANWGTSTRFDAVGFTGITGTTLFTEGTALLPAGGISTAGEHSFVRKGVNAQGGLPLDTDSNQNDFEFVSTSGGTFNTRVSVLGAPGPENLASPTLRNSLQNGMLDPTKSASTSPNRDRDTTPNVCNGGAAPSNCTFGTMTVRRSVTNNTATPLTRLRFRVYEITTLNSPVVVSSQAQLRVLNSGSSAVTVNGVPTTVEGTTVETPPAQPLGGGLNSSTGRSLVAGTVINTAIAPGQTVNVQWVLGVQVTGNYRFFVNIEALP
ncbi:MAG TPA: lamin tail domain-containing protein [Pyrinomonadaceae bacterium]